MKKNYVNFTEDQKKNSGDWNKKMVRLNLPNIRTYSSVNKKTDTKNERFTKMNVPESLIFPLPNIESEFKKVWRQRNFRIKMHSTETREVPG